jgi:hypothetical protein
MAKKLCWCQFAHPRRNKGAKPKENKRKCAMTEYRASIIHQLQDEINVIYKDEQLESIAGLNQSYMINGKQVLAWHGQIATKSKPLNPNFNFIQSFDDCAICFDEVMYFTAHLYLYRPFINNPIFNAVNVNGTTFYPNNQNLAAKRYHMYINIVYEKLYNYWDKIGDLIAAHFPNDIKPEEVYYSTAINVARRYFKNSTSLNWHITFRDSGYKEINGKRKKTVHYSGSDTEYRWNHIQHFTNEQELLKMQQELLSLPDKFKQQMLNMKQGLYNCFAFLEEFHNSRKP